MDLGKCSQSAVQSVGVHNLMVHQVLRLSYLLHYTSIVQCRDSILKSIEKKLNSSDLNDYDLLMAASIYFNEQVCDCIVFLISFCLLFSVSPSSVCRNGPSALSLLRCTPKGPWLLPRVYHFTQEEWSCVANYSQS